MNENYCKDCVDAANLRKIFEDTSSSFLKFRSQKRTEHTRSGGSYEIWQDFKSNDELMKVWGIFYEGIRDSTAGFKLYNEYKILKGLTQNEFSDGEGI